VCKRNTQYATRLTTDYWLLATDYWISSVSLLKALRDSLAAGEPVALATVVSAPPDRADWVTRKAVVWLDREPVGTLDAAWLRENMLADAREALSAGRHRLLTVETGTGPLEVFIEVQQRPPTLLIVGAGHVAQPLAQIGAICGFRVCVLDDRAQFANRDRFPTADEIIVADYSEGLRDFPFDRDTSVVLVTRGHSHDVHCLLQILDRPTGYIGMIGSKRRIRAVFQLLEEEQGVSREKLSAVYSPIGLDIGAETPAEIAMAIMAEIIQVRRGGNGGHMRGA
jgi:xanthine dehydrogenase accessory factor